MRLVLLCTACSLVSGAAAAAPPGTTAPGGITVLTLTDAVKLALAHNPDSLSTDEDVRAASGALVQAHALPNPSAFLYVLGNRISPFDSPVPNQYGLTWTIPIGGKRAAGISAARAALDAATATRAGSRHQLAFDVESAYVAVLLDQSQLDFAHQDQAAIHQALDVNEIRAKDGKIAFNDVLKLRIQARGTDDTVRQDELQLASDRADLARLVGADQLAPGFQLAGSLAPPAAPPQLTPDALLAQALANRGDYRALEASERSAAAAVSQARRQPIPDLGVLADYDRVPGSAGAYDLEVSATIPLFDRNAGNVTQAEAARRKAHLATESLRNQLRADAEKAVRTLQTSQARLAVYDKELLSEAQESLDISRHAYEAGHGTLLDYLDAESSYRDVESSYRSAVADAMLAVARVRFVAGEELP